MIKNRGGGELKLTQYIQIYKNKDPLLLNLVVTSFRIGQNRILLKARFRACRLISRASFKALTSYSYILKLRRILVLRRTEHYQLKAK